tara:strand:+ start:360 stop:617 length:258 start_codon:yes stop_codon:yes gene_type:complete
MYLNQEDRDTILQHDKIAQIYRILIAAHLLNIVGQIRELFLRSLKEHPEVLEKMEKEESDEKTKALVRMLLNEIQNDPEYSGINH